MYIVFLPVVTMCASLLLFVYFLFIKNKFLKYTACIIMLSMTIVSALIFTADYIAYLHGGVTTTEHLTTISRSTDNNSVGYFKINDKYWGIGSDIRGNKCRVYYLPISKFIVKVEIPLIVGDFKPSNFIFYKYDSKISQFG